LSAFSESLKFSSNTASEEDADEEAEDFDETDCDLEADFDDAASFPLLLFA
jgi:hypothetical protein